MTTQKPVSLSIDFVSDVVCPWCAIGLESLQTAVRSLEGQVAVDITFQPFELNPKMVPEGEDIAEHLQKKYGSTPEQAAGARENIRQRGAALGFVFNMDKRGRIYNTFDAHRLLHWAHSLDAKDSSASGQAGEGALEVAAASTVETREVSNGVSKGVSALPFPASRQLALKKALLKAYFTEGENPSDRELLVRVAESVGLDGERAREILQSDAFVQDVREQEQFFLQHGINSVPAVIINRQHLISGGQPPEVFAQALRQIAGV